MFIFDSYCQHVLHRMVESSTQVTIYKIIMSKEQMIIELILNYGVLVNNGIWIITRIEISINQTCSYFLLFIIYYLLVS